jgi:hypothetical protein
MQKHGRSYAQTVKGQWFDTSPAPSAYTRTIVNPLLPQACSGKRSTKLVANVPGRFINSRAYMRSLWFPTALGN